MRDVRRCTLLDLLKHKFSTRGIVNGVIGPGTVKKLWTLTGIDDGHIVHDFHSLIGNCSSGMLSRAGMSFELMLEGCLRGSRALMSELMRCPS